MTSGTLVAINDSGGNDVHRSSEFHGQRVIVTGATSGIGAAAARWFGDRGARLLLTGRDRGRGERVLEQVQKSTDDARFIAGDLGDSLFCEALIDAAVQRWNGVDVLVNCAGVIYRADAANTTDAQWRTTLAINATAAFFLCRAALKVMKLQGAGSIVNVASDWGLVGGEQAVAYCASKGALVLMTKAMALDHARDGVRINAVCPGDTDTPMIERELAALDLPMARGKSDWAEDIPMNRLGTPEEVATVIGFLASRRAGFVTGVALPVDGGHTAG